MSTVLEITQLTNGDVVLRDADDEGEPLVRISFSEEVRDMLGGEVVDVAEAMIDAATELMGSEPPDPSETDVNEDEAEAAPPVIH